MFIFGALLVVFAGSQLTTAAVGIGKATGITTAWIGALLLPLATTLPELVTTIRASLIGAPDLALANLFGSCLFNLSLLVVLDLMEKRGPILTVVEKSQALPASMSILQFTLALTGMLGLVVINAGRIGLDSVALVLVYLVASRLIYRLDKHSQLKPAEEPKTVSSVTRNVKRSAWLRFALAAGVVLIAGSATTDAADILALKTGLGHSFIGTLLLAVSTSLPETVTTVSAMRLGFSDMAVANILGANLMNMFVVFWADLFFREGPILAAASPVNTTMVLALILFKAILIAAVVGRRGTTAKKYLPVGSETLLIALGYLVVMLLVYRAGGI